RFDDDDDQSFGTLPIGGIGGTLEAPVFNIDTFRVATDEGVDLVWDSVQVLVLDIHPDIDGVLGADVLSSGWVDLFADSPDTGPIKQVLFDFTQFQVEGDRGSLVLELDPDYDLVQSMGLDGDFDGDLVITNDDLNLWRAGFGMVQGARLVDGDDNVDGDVDGVDFLRWQRNVTVTQAGDFNSDGAVNAADRSVWQTGFEQGTYTGSDFLTWQRNLSAGAGSAQATVVPEPSGLLLALAAMATIAACRLRPFP
ncbi:MAG: hypothetical protein ACC645_19005, partial [Pirellulales bacterium]